MLAEYIGADLGRLANEVDKLVLNLKPGQPIDEELVQRMVGISKDYNIFELQKALVQRDVLKANRILAYFAANPKANPLIPNLTLLFNFFTKLLVLHQAGPNPSDGVFKKPGHHEQLCPEGVPAGPARVTRPSGWWTSSTSSAGPMRRARASKAARWTTPKFCASWCG